MRICRAMASSALRNASVLTSPTPSGRPASSRAALSRMRLNASLAVAPVAVSRAASSTRGTSDGSRFAIGWLAAAIGAAPVEFAHAASSASAEMARNAPKLATTTVSRIGPRMMRGARRLHRRLRHARFAVERFLGAILERHVGRQHHRAGADFLVLDVDAGRRHAFVEQRLGGAHQAVPRHDDAVVGGDQVLFGAVADRTHAFLERSVLHGEAGDAAIGAASLLRGAVDQIIVILVGERPERGVDFAMYAGAVLHGIDLGLAQRPYRMEVVGPGPAILVVDRHPEMAVDRMVAARRDHGEARHHPRRDAPVIFAVLGIAPRADEEPT